MRLDEETDEEVLHGALIHADLAIAVLVRPRRMLQSVERGLAGEHGATGAAGRELPRDEPENRIVAQFVMIVQVLVAER